MCILAWKKHFLRSYSSSENGIQSTIEFRRNVIGGQSGRVAAHTIDKGHSVEGEVSWASFIQVWESSGQENHWGMDLKKYWQQENPYAGSVFHRIYVSGFFVFQRENEWPRIFKLWVWLTFYLDKKININNVRQVESSPVQTKEDKDHRKHKETTRIHHCEGHCKRGRICFREIMNGFWSS